MNDTNASIHGNENIDPADETQTSARGRPGGRGRTGKIARLPYALRQQLNRRMRDGEPGAKLLEWLNGLPEVQSFLVAQFKGYAIKKQNLSQWRRGGYQDFLKEEVTRGELRTFLEEIKGLQEEAKDGLTDQLALYLAVQAALEMKRLKSAPPDDTTAEQWRELRARVVELRRGDLAAERNRIQREKLDLRNKTDEERKAEFWKWAEENVNRDEFCRRRCYTYAERDAAINKILGITPVDQSETVPEEPTPPTLDPGATESDPVNPGQS